MALAGAATMRRVVLAGRTVLVRDRAKPIPPSLRLLIEGGRDDRGVLHHPIRQSVREPLRLGGAASACAGSSNGDPALNHRLRRWLEGFHVGTDGVSRYLSLHACADCGAVCVRDRSFDSLASLSGDQRDERSAGRRPLRRRDEVIGWYSGARPKARVYT